MLFLNAIRSLKKRSFTILLLGLIIILSGFIFVSVHYSINAIKAPSETYFEQYNQEHFNVIMSQILSEEEQDLTESVLSEKLRSLNEVYGQDIDLFNDIITQRTERFMVTYDATHVEARIAKDIYYNRFGAQHLMRILKNSETINQSFIYRGELPKDVHEIALVINYAEANDISIGDTLTLQGHDYKVSGFVFFPDYSLAVLGNEFIINNSTRTLGLLSDAGFERLQRDITVDLAGIFIRDVNRSRYFDAIQEDFILNIALTENTMRSGAIYEELRGGEAMGLLMSLIIASMAIFVVGLMISRILSEQRGAIGILKALGYRNHEIIVPYLMFIVLIALPGLAIGYGLGFLAAEPLKNIYIGIYLLPNSAIEHSLPIFIISIVAPLLTMLVLGYFVIYRLLKVHPIALMHPKVDAPKQWINSPKLKRNTPLLKRLKHAYILRNKPRFMVYITGVLTATILILMSLSMVNVFDRMIDGYQNSIDVNYMGYCDSLGGCPSETQTVDKVIELPHVLLNQTPVTAIGLDPNNHFHPLFEKDENITYRLNQQGIIITKTIALEHKISVGDMVEIGYGTDKTSLKVVGIQEEYGAPKFYVNREALSLVVTRNSTEYYNVVYANEALTGTYIQEVDVQDIVEQAKVLGQLGNVMSYVLIAVSMSLGVIVLMLITSMSLEQYFFDISLFKVIGYTESEIRSIFTNTYRLYTVLVYLFAIPITQVSLGLITHYLATQFGMIFPLQLRVIDGIVGLVIALGIYYLAIPIANKKLNRLSLQQAIQIYQST